MRGLAGVNPRPASASGYDEALRTTANWEHDG